MTRKIGKFSLVEKVYEGPNSEVYRGASDSDRPYIVKVLKQDYPSPQELARYRQEYEITRRLEDVEGVISAYALEPDRRTLAIVLEDFGGISLAQLMQHSQLFPADERGRLYRFLSLAIAIADALGHIHARNIIHKDINPANIVCNPETGAVKIIDFGIATAISRENPTLKHPNVLEGTLSYMSPEQTGRMNRTVDYRTDFYSLGISFYELLVGQTPFLAQDVMELVHCHLARQPEEPSRILERQGRPTLPAPVESIVMKLMAKTAENRYQSAWGLKADLEECRDRLEATGHIEDFPLGTRDISDKFQIPQKLYGREREIETLLAAFERVSGAGQSNENQSVIPAALGSTFEIMLVAGQPGIGKSALVREVYKPITEKRGYFIAGKFDQLQRNVPYSALVSAFRGLVRQLLSENEARLAHWREKLLKALQSNGQIVIDVISEVEPIIGKQPEVAALGPVESQNRFNLVFRKFIQVFCQPEHPLVIFLDDLQWVDSATLKLLEAIATSDEIQHLFLIGAYRDNEVDSAHPLVMSLEKLRKEGVAIRKISLAPLSLEWVGHLIAETFSKPYEAALPLAQLVRQKTQGNPFFISQFLNILYREASIEFVPDALAWHWDIARIEAQDITDNVVELTISNVRNLSENAQQALCLAACIGASFDLQTLGIVLLERPRQEIFRDLLTAIRSGFVLPTSELDTELLVQNYKFSHDRVQQAAYALIDEDQKPALHLQIGTLLQASLPEAEQAERIFEIVDHLNIGRALIASPQERLQLAELNSAAGKKAKESTAYGAALQYFGAGTQLLGERGWSEAHALAFSLHGDLAEVCYLEGDLDRAQSQIDILLERGRTNSDRAAAYSLLILTHTLQAEYTEAIEVGRAALQLLGIELPTDDRLSEHLERELARAKQAWQAREIAALAHEPEMQIPEKIRAIELLKQLIVPAYVTNQDLFALIAAKSSNLAFQHGPTPESALGYSCYGTVLARSGDYQSGYEFALMSLTLTKRFGDLKNRAKAYDLLLDHIAHWVKPLASLVPLRDEGYEAALISGDLQFACYLLNAKIAHGLILGQNLEEILEWCFSYSDLAEETRNTLAINTLLAYRFTILNLLDRTRGTFALHDQNNLESEYAEKLQSDSDYYSSCLFHYLRLVVAYLYGDFSRALECARLANQFIAAIQNLVQEADFVFYWSLSLVAACHRVRLDRQQEYSSQAKANLVRLQAWSELCPENFLHKYLLVEAELCRLEERPFEAMQLYDRAIAAAAEQGFIQNEALANELAAKFWLARGKEDFAYVHLRNARHGYELWGATRKVELLEATYPKCFVVPGRRYGGRIDTTTTTGSTSFASLDLSSVLQASQALSEEIQLESLLAKLMKLAIENAGAQRACLLLEKGGQWVIEAEGHLERDEITVLRSIPIDAADSPALLSRMIVNYVARSAESIVLDNAALEGQYAQDLYIAEHQIASVLCIPLLVHGNMSGILYLENNLIERAFTPERIETLKLLSTQAAISLNIARLYVALQASERNLADYNQTLEQRVQERTAELTEANERIATLNKRLQAENLRMEAELNVARQIQQTILPRAEELRDLKGLDVACLMQPADEVAGDYYDIFQIDDRVTFSIGDVTGHGLESGLLMLMAQTAVRALTEIRERDPVKFLGALNRTIYSNVQRMDSEKSLTLAVLDYEEGRISISGQHEEVLVVRAGGEIERVDTIDLGMPIGLDGDIDRFIDRTSIDLDIGDGVVLYTDGILEAINLQEEQYGIERFCRVIRREWQHDSQAIRQAIVVDVAQFIDTQQYSDDIALIVLKRR